MLMNSCSNFHQKLNLSGHYTTIFVRMQRIITPLHAHENFSVGLFLNIYFYEAITTNTFLLLSISLSLFFHECRKKVFLVVCFACEQVSRLDFFMSGGTRKNVLEQIFYSFVPLRKKLHWVFFAALQKNNHHWAWLISFMRVQWSNVALHAHENSSSVPLAY